MRASTQEAAQATEGEEQKEGGEEDEVDYMAFTRNQVRTNSEAIEIIGMGTWRVKEMTDPPIQQLVAYLEGTWRHALLESIGLYPLEEELKMVDSMDLYCEREGLAYAEIPNPDEGEAGYPRLLIENRVYQSNVFRKLHMEVGVRQDGLQVLHCVTYPRLEYDLPIFSLDVVVREGRITLAVCDPCPVKMDRSLPPIFEEAARMLQERHGLASNRKVPEWGKEIFSDYCLLMQPKSSEELSSFIKYVISLHEIYMRIAVNIAPMQTQREQRLREIHAAHSRYSEKQLENTKTRKVLEMAFGQEFTDLYMEYLLFDVEPLPGTEDEEDEEGEDYDEGYDESNERDEPAEYDDDSPVVVNGEADDDSRVVRAEGVPAETGEGGEVEGRKEGEREKEGERSAASPEGGVEEKGRGKKSRFEDQE